MVMLRSAAKWTLSASQVALFKRPARPKRLDAVLTFSLFKKDDKHIAAFGREMQLRLWFNFTF